MSLPALPVTADTRSITERVNVLIRDRNEAETQPAAAQVLQVVSFQTGGVATGTGTIPFDDTIPQQTEGDQYMSLSITPKSASSRLIIDVVWNGANSGTLSHVVALFRDSVVNALAVTGESPGGAHFAMSIAFRHVMTSGTTSATTFKVRAGASAAATTTFNGFAGGRSFGGVYASSITIVEVLP